MEEVTTQDGVDQPELSPRSLPSKARSMSDPPTAPMLAPSPKFRESGRWTSKDDYALPTTPRPIRRPDFLAQGLSLQMPPTDMTPAAATTQADRAVTPQYEGHHHNNNNNFIVQSQSQAASPVTSLPRHSRGLDFSRASTNLHHSTIAEQSSPDLSPIITQRGMNIPQRKMSVSSMALDSPRLGPTGGAWGSLAPERSAVSSSVGSVNMLASDSESNSSDDDASMGGDDIEDTIYNTPHVHKIHNQHMTTPFSNSHTWGITNAQSPAAASLLRTIRKSRLGKGSRRPNKSSSASASNSGYSSMNSPRASSPPPLKSIEGGGPGYFNWPRSRRESLALGTDGLHLSSGNDSGDEGSGAAPTTPGVVRRPVVRRGNLLPKTKGFARIRAALMEEASPVDSETRREAETIKQVRERDGSDSLDLEPRVHPTTAPSSPGLLPAVPESAQEDFGQELDADATPMAKGLGVNFSLHAHRNSAGPGFWNRFDPSSGTPPPIFPISLSRQSSTMNSDDSPIASGNEPFQRMRGRAQSTASDMSDVMGIAAHPSTGAATGISDDMHLKKFKRRREDDYDISTIKRRAVSPGMSAQNSPIVAQSPFQKDGAWGMPPERRRDREYNTSSDGGVVSQTPPVRSGSNGSCTGTPLMSHGFVGGPGKKLGLQGMVDTHDGLMKMSIE